MRMQQSVISIESLKSQLLPPAPSPNNECIQLELLIYLFIAVLKVLAIGFMRLGYYRVMGTVHLGWRSLLNIQYLFLSMVGNQGKQSLLME